MDLRKLGGCKPKPAIYRFNMSHVKDEITGCWNWLGKSRSGSSRLYGRITVGKKTIPAHKFSWEIHNEKKIPNGMFVLHKCDNPECVNPEHLFLGTHQDNMNDKVKKGRQANGESLSLAQKAKNKKGEENHKSKLTNLQVIEIYKSELPQRILAEKFNVSQTNINWIKKGRTWKHLTNTLL